jgi:hypothetical protein
MATNGDPPNAWPPYRPREDDQQWTRQYINGSWPARDVSEYAMRELTDELRVTRDPMEVLMRLERRYEALLIEHQRSQQDLRYYRELSQQQQAQLMRVAERTAAPLMIGTISGFNIPSPEQQAALARTPIYEMGSRYDRSMVNEMRTLQERNVQDMVNAFRLPSEMFAEKLANDRGFSIFAKEEKKPEATGRIIDLES